MNVIIKKTPTTVLFKSYIEHLIGKYHEIGEQYETAFRSANKRFKDDSASDTYTADYIRKNLDLSLKEATEKYEKETAQLNEKAKKYISELKEKIIPALSEFDKSADYAIKINNALQFVNIEGAEIDDATAFQILHDFVKDVDTMRRFRSMIEHMKDEGLSDIYGRTTFPLTFGWLDKCERYIKAFEEFETIIDRLFIYQKIKTETEITPGGIELYIPQDGISQPICEDRAIQQAKTLEAMTGELFTTTD